MILAQHTLTLGHDKQRLDLTISESMVLTIRVEDDGRIAEASFINQDDVDRVRAFLNRYAGRPKEDQ